MSQAKFNDSNNYAGIWFVIHLLARNAITPEREREFERIIKEIANNLKCMTCREHALQYIEQHPISNYYGVTNQEGQVVGMFKWSFLFHNDVNYRIGKKQLDWESAYAMYAPDNGICQEGCGEHTTIKNLSQYTSVYVPTTTSRSMTSTTPSTGSATRSSTSSISKGYTTPSTAKVISGKIVSKRN